MKVTYCHWHNHIKNNSLTLHSGRPDFDSNNTEINLKEQSVVLTLWAWAAACNAIVSSLTTINSFHQLYWCFKKNKVLKKYWLLPTSLMFFRWSFMSDWEIIWKFCTCNLINFAKKFFLDGYFFFCKIWVNL